MACFVLVIEKLDIEIYLESSAQAEMRALAHLDFGFWNFYEGGLEVVSLVQQN